MRRYPGVSPFTRDQRNIFFGRSEDIKKLKKLILLRNQVLLYSKSGIGKTSLLDSGVIPLLSDKYETIQIRFTAYNEKSYLSPVDTIVKTLGLFLRKKQLFETIYKDMAEIDDFFSEASTPKTLWYYFKKIQLADCFPKKILLVFDQFEELFSYPTELINEFKEQLAELTRVLIPDSMIERINRQLDDPDEQDEARDKLSDKLDLKTVFAIRSDRLSLLNKLSDKIPDIQEVYYELEPLNYAQVKEAIVNPALEENPALEGAAFTYAASTITKIIDELSEQRTQKIETTQLQIVCQQIEEIAEKKASESLNVQKKVEIQPQDLPKFEAIFFTFYEQAVARIPDNKRHDARRLIEDQLVRNNQRISLDENICVDFLNKNSLSILVNTHLLRAERNSLGGISYELSHDTLVKPITDARDTWLQKEEEARAEAERQEELRIAEAKAEKERAEREKERKRQRQIIIIVSIAAVFSIAFGIFGFVNMQKANQNLSNAIKWQVQGKKKDAISYKTQEVYGAAITKYGELLGIYRKYPEYNYDTAAVYKDIEECNTLSKKSELFHEYMTIADSLIEKNNLENIKAAYQYYQKSDSINYPYAEKTFTKFDIKLQQAIENLKDQEEILLESGGEGKKIAIEISKFLKTIT